jgi:ribosome-associated toxin RatA of RatAB toxin-antitoxin module
MPAFHFVCMAILGALIWQSGSACAKQLTDVEQRRLRAGHAFVRVKPLRNSSIVILAAIDMPASREVVWKILTDCKNSSGQIPYVRSCRILTSSSDGREDIREFVGDLGILAVRSVIRSGYDKPTRITFKAIGGDFAELSGEWRFEPVDKNQATRVTYEAELSIPKLIPGFLARDAIEADVPRILIDLRDIVIRSRRP